MTHPLDGDAALIPDSGVDAGAFDSGPDSGASVAQSFYELCVELARTGCAGNVACCLIPERVFAPCTEEPGERYCRELSRDPALSDGTLAWRQAEATAYVSRMETARAGCDAIDREAELFDFLDGTLREGDVCTPFREGSWLGQFRCAEGLRCELTGDDSDYVGRCAPLGADGDSCMDDCADGYWCNRRLRMPATDPPFQGRCELRDATAVCVADKQCLSVFCDIWGSGASDACVDPAPGNTWCSQIN